MQTSLGKKIDHLGVGILKLSPSCIARTNTVKLTASRDIITTSSFNILNGSNLNLISILNALDSEYFVQVLNNTVIQRKLNFGSKGLQKPLEMSHNLDEIIGRSKVWTRRK